MGSVKPVESMQSKEAGKIPALDGIRGLAILFVLVWHYIPCQILDSPIPGSWQSYALKYLRTSWSGVDLFFVLSGFLIFRLLFEKQNTARNFVSFYVRRVSRTLPLYLVLVLSFFLFKSLVSSPDKFSWLLNGSLPFWSYLTFTQNWIMGIRGTFGSHWFGITWSLAIEEQFYLLSPLILFLLARLKPVYVLGVLVIGPPILRLFFGGMLAYVGTLFRFDSLAFGILVAWLAMQEELWFWLQSHSKWIFRLLYCLFGLILCNLCFPKMSIGGWFDVHLVYGFFFASLLLSVLLKESWLSRFLSFRLLRSLGKISYGVYLSHQLLTGILHGLFFSSPPSLSTPQSALTSLAALFLSLIISQVLYWVIEAPFIRWGRKVSLLLLKDSSSPSLNFRFS